LKVDPTREENSMTFAPLPPIRPRRSAKPLIRAAALLIMMASTTGESHAVYSTSVVASAWTQAPTFHSGVSSSDDALSSTVDLPFWFPFQDDIFNKLRIHTNGFIVLGPGTGGLNCGSCFDHKAFLSAGQPEAPDYILAPWWADWNPATAGDVFHGLSPDGGRYIIEWRNVQPFGASGAYSFAVHLFPDGRFNFVYGQIHGGSSTFNGVAKGSVGFQARSASNTTKNVAFNNGAFASNSAVALQRASDALNLATFNLDPEVPDIVERWAPLIWADVEFRSTGTGGVSARGDLISSVTYDSDFNAANNSSRKYNTNYSMPGTVYYSLVDGPTHYFIGYYFYHAHSWGGGHENDWEGTLLAVHKDTQSLDAVLTNEHGRLRNFRSPFAPTIVPQNYPVSEERKVFSFFTVQHAGLGLTYDTLAVGMESGTHAVWGRWHDKCVIGPGGSASGCDNSKGGDGVVYMYSPAATEPTTFPQYPNWLNGLSYYRLTPIRALLDHANSPGSCGQSHLYACQSQPQPWDVMNGAGDDKGDLPWVWRPNPTGDNNIITSACNTINERSALVHPAFTFAHKFSWPPGRYTCGEVSNEYRAAMPPGCTLPPACQ
jgi:hypothetical protein